MIAHGGSLEDIDAILRNLPQGFIQEAMHIINAYLFVRLTDAIPEKGWEEDVIC